MAAMNTPSTSDSYSVGKRTLRLRVIYATVICAVILRGAVSHYFKTREVAKDGEAFNRAKRLDVATGQPPAPAAAQASAPEPYTTPATESAFAQLPEGRVIVEQTVEADHGFITWVYGHIFDEKSTPIKLTLSCSLPTPNGECARLKPGEIYHIKFLSDRDKDAYLRVPYSLGSVIVSGAAGRHLVFGIIDEAAVHSMAAREREERVAARKEPK